MVGGACFPGVCHHDSLHGARVILEQRIGPARRFGITEALGPQRPHQRSVGGRIMGSRESRPNRRCVVAATKDLAAPLPPAAPPPSPRRRLAPTPAGPGRPETSQGAISPPSREQERRQPTDPL